MATATTADSGVPESAPEPVKSRTYDPRKLIYVYDVQTGAKLNDPVPETWLDGRFPQLSETPSKKAGK